MKKIIHKSPTQTVFEDGTSIRKTNKDSWIDKFYEIYIRERICNNAPENYIDYFKARYFI